MPSRFDDVYYQLFGEYCKKEGQAFERLAAAITKIIAPSLGVKADQRLRGLISQSLYQIDVLSVDSKGKSFGEAKDYSDRAAKVGRGDLQKLVGALADVEAYKAVFYSATNYTREARRYANSAGGLVGKPIELMHIKPSCDDDEKGRIKSIRLSMHIYIADTAKARFKPVLATGASDKLQSWVISKGLGQFETNLALRELYDQNGNLRLTTQELTSFGYGGDEEKAWGSFWLPGHYLKLEDLLVEISGIEYLVPFEHETRTLEIVASGKPMILVKSDRGDINKLITDEQLVRTRFSESGEVLLAD